MKPAPGTSAAFESIVARHELAVLRLCRSIVRDHHLGTDAAQETFARLWRRLLAGRGTERVGAWLRRAAVSASVDLLRRRAVRPAEPLDAVLVASPHGTEEDVPAAGAQAAELEERFEAALAGLSEGQRTVFLMRHSAGLSLAEVAAALGVSTSTAKTQFARACLKLQEALRPYAPEDSR